MDNRQLRLAWKDNLTAPGAVCAIRETVEQKLADMLARNPMRTDYQAKYEGIIADYNSEKDRTTIEERTMASGESTSVDGSSLLEVARAPSF